MNAEVISQASTGEIGFQIIILHLILMRIVEEEIDPVEVDLVKLLSNGELGATWNIFRGVAFGPMA